MFPRPNHNDYWNGVNDKSQQDQIHPPASNTAYPLQIA